ncbi:MAG: glycosyltransferase family 9 protein [Promethearchaeota archaeon]
MIRTDCIYYKGDIPCIFHKKYKIECNENCSYYKKIGLRILIIKKDAIGDVLRTTPILYSIKKKFGNNIHITWLTDSSAYKLLKYNPLINKIYKFNFKTIISLEIERFDILFNLDKDISALALSKKLNVKHKFGYTMNQYGNLITFNHKEHYAHLLGISDMLKKENKKTYQEIICDLLDLPYSREFKYILKIPNINEILKKLCNKYKINKKNLIIGFNTGVGAKFLTKKWPEEYFVKLGIMLIKKQNYTVLLFGAKLEKEINENIFEKIKNALPKNLRTKIINTGINNNLLEFSALVSLSNVIVTGDTLGLHLAIALEIPSLSFFGPTSSKEIDLYETGEKIIANSPCLLCYRKKCNYPVFCLNNISPEYVYKRIVKIIIEKNIENSLEQ